MRALVRRLAALALALAAAGCGGDDGGGESFTPPPAPSVVASCTDTNGTPLDASVVAQCGSVTSGQIDVDIVVTNTPGGEEVISAVLDLSIAPQVGAFVLAFVSCSVPATGGALGDAADLDVSCGTDQFDATEILVAVTRRGAGTAGVPVVGSATLITLTFRVTGAGDAPLQFLAQNQADGSALLRRSAADPSQVEVIGGITFSGAALSGG